MILCGFCDMLACPWWWCPWWHFPSNSGSGFRKSLPQHIPSLPLSVCRLGGHCGVHEQRCRALPQHGQEACWHLLFHPSSMNFGLGCSWFSILSFQALLFNLHCMSFIWNIHAWWTDVFLLHGRAISRSISSYLVSFAKPILRSPTQGTKSPTLLICLHRPINVPKLDGKSFQDI